MGSKSLDCKTVRLFAYSNTHEQSNKRSGMRVKTESETGERHARKTLTPRFTDFFTDVEKETDCFAVYQKLHITFKSLLVLKNLSFCTVYFY